MTRHQSEPERRAQILRAARAVFVERGFLPCRVEDVAERAGLSKGAVYFYFSSKRDILLALVREEHERTYTFLDEAERDERPARDKLLDLGARYLGLISGLHTPPRFFLIMTEHAVRDDDIREEVQAVHQRFVDATARIYAQGVAEGAFRPLDALVVARMLKAVIDGFAGQAAIGLRPEREALLRDGLAVILRGILVDRAAASPASPAVPTALPEAPP